MNTAGDAANQITIGVAAWCSWRPVGGRAPTSGAGESSLSASGRIEDLKQEQLEQPALSGIPPLLRRRIKGLARVVFHVLERALGQAPAAEECVIFSSRMGEIRRTQDILESIAAEQPVSPAAFSHAVHNAIAGLWSMAHGATLPLLALSPPEGGPVPALIEAYGCLAENGGKPVTIVCYEEQLPEFYAPFLSGPPAPTAVAARLAPAERAERILSLRHKESLNHRPPADGAAGGALVSPAPPAPAAWRNSGSDDSAESGLQGFIDLLHGKTASAVLAAPTCQWQLQMAA